MVSVSYWDLNTSLLVSGDAQLLELLDAPRRLLRSGLSWRSLFRDDVVSLHRDTRQTVAVSKAKFDNTVGTLQSGTHSMCEESISIISFVGRLKVR